MRKFLQVVDYTLHTVGLVVVIAALFGWLDLHVTHAIAWIVVALVGIPYPGLHGKDEDDV